MPAAAPDMPRKMLPPPITMHDLHAHAGDDPDIGGDGANGIVVEAILAAAHQGLA